MFTVTNAVSAPPLAIVSAVLAAHGCAPKTPENYTELDIKSKGQADAWPLAFYMG